MNAAVAAGWIRWVTEELLVMLQTRHPLLVVVAIAFQHFPAGHQATVHFIQPDFVPILGWLVGLVAPDNIGVWLEQAHDLLQGGYLFLLDPPPYRLIHRLLGAWEKGFQDFSQFSSFLGRALLQ